MFGQSRDGRSSGDDGIKDPFDTENLHIPRWPPLPDTRPPLVDPPIRDITIPDEFEDFASNGIMEDDEIYPETGIDDQTYVDEGPPEEGYPEIGTDAPDVEEEVVVVPVEEKPFPWGLVLAGVAVVAYFKFKK